MPTSEELVSFLQSDVDKLLVQASQDGDLNTVKVILSMTANNKPSANAVGEALVDAVIKTKNIEMVNTFLAERVDNKVSYYTIIAALYSVVQFYETPQAIINALLATNIKNEDLLTALSYMDAFPNEKVIKNFVEDSSTKNSALTIRSCINARGNEQTVNAIIAKIKENNFSQEEADKLLFLTISQSFFNQTRTLLLEKTFVEKISKEKALSDAIVAAMRKWKLDVVKMLLSLKISKSDKEHLLGYAFYSFSQQPIQPKNMNVMNHALNNFFNTPVSYTKLTQKNNATLDKIIALLTDYTKNDSVLLRFFCGHINRHHCKEVTALLNKIKENNLGAIETRDELKKIPLVNPIGSLARRIQFIERMIQEDQTNNPSSSSMRLKG